MTESKQIVFEANENNKRIIASKKRLEVKLQEM